MKALLLAVLVAGCVMPPTHDVLPPPSSHALVKVSPDETARALVALFTHRGYPLVDQRQLASGAIVLRLKGAREQITEGGRHWTYSSVVGSVFEAVIEPSGTNLSAIDLTGAPTLNGRESCNGRPDCAPLQVDARQLHDMRGAEEAEVIQGVIAELALEGLAIPPQVSAVDEQYRHCLELRRTIIERANNAVLTYSRERILQTAPTCSR